MSSGSPWINNCWSGLVDDYERPTLLVSLIDKMEYVYSFLVLYLRDTRIAGNNENKYIYIYVYTKDSIETKYRLDLSSREYIIVELL